ncbi:stage III sporulation protein AE [Diplocloster modestus]|uniref:Stage III sporulation protein AE n=1 Tax=Diplocloster modestus TaxID=2850322 RepID=A0ABS6K885_9FIRM|nr:stage III sporulation protein AE [Diplocloster modestus]
MKISRIIFWTAFFLAFFSGGICAYASQTEASQTDSLQADSQQMDTSLLDEVEFGDIQQTLDEVLGDSDVDFEGTVRKVLDGDAKFSLDLVKDLVFGRIEQEFGNNRRMLVQILILVTASAIFMNFANVFENQQIAEVSFYIIYLLLLAILITSFETITKLTTGAIGGILDFMRALIPAYFLTVAVASGGTTATAFYGFTLGLVYLVNWILLNIILPMIHIYVILVLVNNLSKEDFLSRLASLIRSVVEWILKSLLALVIGFSVIQSLIAPAVDAFRVSVLNKTAGIIPGVGGTINAVTEVIIGSSVLIKNSIGVAAMIILLLICLVPVLKLAIYTFLYKLVAAVVQPVSDKRMLGCISCVGEGAKLSMKAIFTAAVLFMVTIAVVSASSLTG